MWARGNEIGGAGTKKGEQKLLTRVEDGGVGKQKMESLLVVLGAEKEACWHFGGEAFSPQGPEKTTNWNLPVLKDNGTIDGLQVY